MKKILFLMFALVMSVSGAWADFFVPEAGKAYQIKSTEGDLYLNVRVDGNTFNNKVTSKDVVLGSKPQALYFTQKDGAYTITTAEGLYVGGHSNAWNMSATMEQLWQVPEVETGVYAFLCNGTEANYIGFDATTVGSAAYRNKDYSEKHGKFIIEECTKDNFVPSIYKTFFTSPAPVDGQWQNGTIFYTIKCKRAGYLASDRTNGSQGVLTLNNSTAPTNDAGKWAMVQTGNGFQFFNKATGESKVLTMSSGTSNSSYAYMGTDLNATNSYFDGRTAINQYFESGYEAIMIHGSDNYYWNEMASTTSPTNVSHVATWNSEYALAGWGQTLGNTSATGDEGSKFKFTKVEEIKAVSYTITVEGAPAGQDVTVSVKGEARTIGVPFELPSSISAADVTATEIPAYSYEVEVGENTITVTYTYDPYHVNYDKNGNKSNTDRNINSIALTQEGGTTQSVDVTNPGKTYNDLTAQKFTVEAGSTVTPNMVGVGSWYHGYVYVDENENEAFEFAEYESELVSYTAYRAGETGQAHNSAGTYFNASGGTPWSDGVNGKFPSFVAPQNVGTYRMRYKTDWNNINPGGGPTMWNDRGQIIDILLEVVAPATKATVTYEINLNGTKIGQEVKEEAIGTNTAYTLPASAADYVNLDFTPAEITGDMTVQVNTTYKEGVIPFTPDGATLYNLSLNRETPLVIYAEGEGISTKATDNESYVAPTYANQNNYKWSFGGDWLHGFTIKNEGTQKYVSYGSNNPNNDTHANFVESTEGDGCHFELRLKNTEKYFRIMGTTDEAYISNYNGPTTTYLTNWNHANNYNNSDRGAQFLIVPNAINPPAIDWTLFGSKLEEVKAYPVGTGLGKYTCSVPRDIARWETTFSERNEVNYSDDLRDIEAAIAGMSFNMPKATGQFFRMKGHSSQKYVYADAASEVNHTSGSIAAANCLPMGDLSGNEATSIFYFDGTHIISYQSPNYTGLYVYQSGLNKNLNDESGLDTFTFNEGVTKGTYRIHTDKANSNLYDFFADNGRTNRWSADDNVRTCFDLEEIESLPVLFKAFGHGYATLYSPVALQIPDEVEAYTAVYSEEKGKLMTDPVEGVIPAGTAVVLHYTGELTEDATVDFEIATLVAVDEMDNDLMGTYTTLSAGENSYVFALQGGNAGFYKYKEGTTGTLAGFKAYYETSAESSTRGFALDFGDVVTAISQLSATTSQPTTAFDLAGRRVNAAQKGILIQNGNKVIR